MRLQLIERDQTNRIVEEGEFQQAVMDDDEEFRVGRLYVSENHIISPSYWKCKVSDVKVVEYQSHLPSLMVNITINPWREEIGRMGLDIVNWNPFLPSTDHVF